MNVSVFPRRRSVEMVLLCVAALALTLETAAPAIAQDRPPSENDRTDTATSAPAQDSGLASEPGFLTRAINFVDKEMTQRRGTGDGFFPELGNMITGSGWISAGPGYRHSLLDGRAVVNVSGAVSWNFYRMAQGRFELPHLMNDQLAVGGQVIYQDLLRVNYFGLGNNSLESDRSGYRLDETDVLGYATVTPRSWLAVNGRFGWIHQAELSTMTGWSASYPSVSYPNTPDIFSDSTAPGLTEQPAFLHGDISVAADTRDYPGHPTRGGLYRATAASYSDRNYGKYSFRRYEVEGSQFVPLVADRWVLALRAWEVISDTPNENVVPFYLMPSLGGKNTLRGYYDYRFHDRNMQVFNAESRWALFTHVDLAVFADAGKVASLASGLDFKQLKTSYGAGIRLHTRTATVGRLDVGHSVEGWHVVLKMNDPFKRSTLSGGRTEVIPFVP